MTPTKYRHQSPPALACFWGSREGGIEMSDSCEARKRGRNGVACWLEPARPDITTMTTLHQNISPCYDPKKTDFSISISRTQKSALFCTFLILTSPKGRVQS